MHPSYPRSSFSCPIASLLTAAPPHPPPPQVIRSLRRGGLFEKVSPEHVLASVADAVAYAEAQDAVPSDKASTPTEGRSSSDEELEGAGASKSFKSSGSQLTA